MPTELLGSLTPAQLSSALRETNGREMRHRRWIAGLSLLSSTLMSGIGLYQLGIIRKVPEPPGFNAEKVNGSPQAYSILKTPDALLGAVSYAATACLAGASDPDRARTAPWVPIAMGAKLAGDAAFAAKLTYDEASQYRAFCFWCLLTTGATFAAAALGVPEVRRAAKNLMTGRSRAEN